MQASTLSNFQLPVLPPDMFNPLFTSKEIDRLFVVVQLRRLPHYQFYAGRWPLLAPFIDSDWALKREQSISFRTTLLDSLSDWNNSTTSVDSIWSALNLVVSLLNAN